MPVTPLRTTDPVQVGPHRLLGRLGQGGMGTVFLGVSPDERAVAVKVLRDPLGDPEARRRFHHELDALRRVRGSHVVEVLDADLDADTPYLVTRFVPGERLDELVARDGPLQGEPLDEIARGVADAVTALHASGVVHRDLTPGNVLVLDGTAHVIDLGLATAVDVTALTRTGLVIGTPGYLAPEQVTGREVTPSVDVHAWGATVALAGTGRPPYGTGRPEAVLYRIVHEEPDLAGLPPRLHELVAAAMDLDPRRRPTAAELLAELGGPSTADAVAVHLPRDVDATTVLATDVLHPGRELVGATCGPRGTVSYDLGAEPERSYDPPSPPWSYDEPPRRRTAPLVVTGAAALAVVFTGTLVAPLVGLALVLVLLVVLRATARSAARMSLRRERRGDRRRDPVVALLGAPWQLLSATVDTLLSLPLLVVTAGLPAGLVWLLDPVVDGLERPELAAATGATTALVVGLARSGSRASRALLRQTLRRTAGSGTSVLAVVVALGAVALVLLAAAEGSAPVWWPAR